MLCRLSSPRKVWSPSVRARGQPVGSKIAYHAASPDSPVSAFSFVAGVLEVSTLPFPDQRDQEIGERAGRRGRAQPHGTIYKERATT